MTPSTPSGIYRHYKGGIYEVLTVARHTESGEDLVIYRSVTNQKIWARPLSMWEERVSVDGESVPRFARIAPDLAAFRTPKTI